MNLTLAAGLIAIATALSLNAYAATDAQTGAEPNAKAKAEKTVPRKNMKPHSHAEEKTGFPQKAPEAMPDKPSAAKDRSKHFHPRDGKLVLTPRTETSSVKVHRFST